MPHANCDAPMTAAKLVLASLLIVVSIVTFLPVQQTRAFPLTINAVNDGVVINILAYDDAGGRLYMGDNTGNQYSRIFLKFDLTGISGTLASAKLYLTLFASYLDGGWTNTGSLPNPGLGNCEVFHVADYGSISGSAWTTTVLGDVGTLIGSTATPTAGTHLSIDITAAMQNDIDNHRSFSAFMLKFDTNTDNDAKQDEWLFVSSRGNEGDPPNAQYELAPPVIPEYPLGLALLAAFMVISYGLIRRRTSTKKF